MVGVRLAERLASSCRVGAALPLDGILPALRGTTLLDSKVSVRNEGRAGVRPLPLIRDDGTDVCGSVLADGELFPVGTVGMPAAMSHSPDVLVRAAVGTAGEEALIAFRLKQCGGRDGTAALSPVELQEEVVKFGKVFDGLAMEADERVVRVRDRLKHRVLVVVAVACVRQARGGSSTTAATGPRRRWCCGAGASTSEWLLLGRARGAGRWRCRSAWMLCC